MPDMPTPKRGLPEDMPHTTSPADLDRRLHVWQSRFTGGRSPSTVALACLDWAVHAANTPFQTASLGHTAFAQWQRLISTAMGGQPAISPQPSDRRFENPAWDKRPFNLLTQAVLLGEEWWDTVLRTPGGV